MNTHRQYCTFSVDQFFFGVEVAQVQEVVRHQIMTYVPLAPREVRGLINLRGQIVAAIDLRRRLSLPDCSADRSLMNVLLRTNDGPVSLLVDQIEDVLEVEPESVEKPPDTLDHKARELISGASKQKNRLLLLLDTRKIVQLAPEKG